MRFSLQNNARFIEEERKYHNNEDFTHFIKKIARQRRIANIFSEMRDQQQKRKEDLGVNCHFAENSVAAAMEKRKTFIKDQ